MGIVQCSQGCIGTPIQCVLVPPYHTVLVRFVKEERYDEKSKFEQILSVFGSGRSPKSLGYAPWVPLVKGLEITFGFDPGLDI